MRITRIIVSGTVLTLFSCVFLGDDALPGFVRDTLLFLQFMPSLVLLKSHPGLFVGAGFFFIIITSVIFGRVYCALLCPLGVLQDIFIWLSRIFGIKKTHAFQKPYPRIRYGITIVTMMTFFLGSMDMIGLLDPLSVFGRVAANLFKPAALAMHNMALSFLEFFDIYILSVKKLHFVSWSLTIITVLSFMAVLFFSLFHGRLYCNTICPVGGLIGLLSSRSLFRFGLDKTKCVSCGACEKVCKAGCIDVERMSIDSNRCVSCFNCLDVCGKRAVRYDILTKENFIRSFFPGAHVPARRHWLMGSMTAGVSIVFSFYPLTILSRISPSESIPVLPPGSVSINRFRKICLGCDLCVSVCPTNVIIPGASSFFSPGFLMPEMDFNRGFCDMACHACGQACPTDAIKAMPLHLKKEVRVGSAVLHKDLCIVHVKKKHCGACGEACPTSAISPVEKGQVLFPKLNPDYCIGCGACVYACPTKPKAIIVKAIPIHEKAETYRLVKKQVLPLPSQNGDFPF